MSIRSYLEWVHCDQKTQSNHEHHHSLGWGVILQRKKERKKAGNYLSSGIHSSLLTSCLLPYDFPAMVDCIPLNCEPQ